jgi:hypothetical protein
MDRVTFAELHRNGDFPVRRAIERLREGIYDPLAVRLLTAHHQELDARFDADSQRLETGKAAHLCVCGPYGQGKSHSLSYLQERALQQGCVVSAINLDPREAPLHLFRQVYRALLESLTFPAGSDASATPTSLVDAWQAWVKTQSLPPQDPSIALAGLLPANMPHTFKAILVALAQTTVYVPQGRRALRQYRDYRPMDFPMILRRALRGEAIPVMRLRPALKYRQVTFYRQESLALRGDAPFLQMIAALSQLFRRMGYKGWVLLFDEGEAVLQVRSPLRARSYRILHQLLYPPSSQPGCYPVFAFTPDFFQQIHEENYDLPYFDRDYATTWRDLSVYQLRGLSLDAWRELCETLISLHTAAYRWSTDRESLSSMLAEQLHTLPLQDTRVTLKALVDALDHVQQQAFFAQRSEGGR